MDKEELDQLKPEEIPERIRSYVMKYLDFNDQPIGASLTDGKTLRGIKVTCSHCGKKWYTAVHRYRNIDLSVMESTDNFEIMCETCQAKVPLWMIRNEKTD